MQVSLMTEDFKSDLSVRIRFMRFICVLLRESNMSFETPFHFSHFFCAFFITAEQTEKYAEGHRASSLRPSGFSLWLNFSIALPGSKHTMTWRHRTLRPAMEASILILSPSQRSPSPCSLTPSQSFQWLFQFSLSSLLSLSSQQFQLHPDPCRFLQGLI